MSFALRYSAYPSEYRVADPLLRKDVRVWTFQLRVVGDEPDDERDHRFVQLPDQLAVLGTSLPE